MASSGGWKALLYAGRARSHVAQRNISPLLSKSIAPARHDIEHGLVLAK
jgi:hypothetical protein